MTTRSRHSLYVFAILLSQIPISCTRKSKTPETHTTVATNASAMLTPAVANPARAKCGKPALLNISSQKRNVMTAGGRSAGDVVEGSYFVHWGTEAGLAQNTIWCSIIDSKGNLWFGTNGAGASKFDGAAFETLNTQNGLVQNSVRGITEDSKGNIWFCTQNGLSLNNGTLIKNYLNKVSVLCAMEDRDGSLLIGTFKDGVFRYDGKGFSRYPVTSETGKPITSVRCIMRDSKDRLWFGTDSSGAIMCNKSTFVSYSRESGHLASNVVYSIIEDSRGNIWFGTDGGGVTQYLAKENEFITDTAGQGGLSHSKIHIIKEAHDGKIWIGTYGGGLAMYDPKTSPAHHKSYRVFRQVNGFDDDRINSIVEDKYGNLWIGTYSKGVIEYRGGVFKSYGFKQGMNDNIVYAITTDHAGNIWLGLEALGIVKYDHKTFTNYPIEKTIWSACSDSKHNLWFGTRSGGVIKYDGKAFYEYNVAQKLSSSTVWSILEDRQGNMWFGTKEGACRLANDTFHVYNKASGFTNDDVYDIFQDSDNAIWFATKSEGVYKLDGSKVYHLTSDIGLAGDNVYDINQDKDGHILVGTDKGISRIFQDFTTTGLKTRVVNYSISEGLPDNFIRHVIPKGDKVFASTNKGVVIFDANFALDSNKKLQNIKVYNTQTGYPIRSINPGQSSMLVDDNQVVWFGDMNIGLCRLAYRDIFRIKNAPRVTIEQIKLSEQTVPWHILNTRGNNAEEELASELYFSARKFSDSECNVLLQKYEGIHFSGLMRFYEVPENLTLPYTQNNITIKFNCIEVSRHNLVRYKYKLEGYDKEWSPIVDKQEASFGNIPEGAYAFKVKACSPDGTWGADTIFRFTVSPPWYRTLWAYLGYVVSGLILMVGTAIGYGRWRTATYRQRQKELEQTVEERTQEVLLQKQEAEKQFQRSEGLLLNILPQEVAQELKETGGAKARLYKNVTVLFTDFAGFTNISERLTAEELVRDLDYFFQNFDEIIYRNNAEKIKTIGDSYMAVGGLPMENETHAEDVVRAGLEIRDFIAAENKRRSEAGLEVFNIRIGINSGEVVAGIVGSKKYAYDIWGDTVNVASRMESSGEPQTVNISESTYLLVRDKFQCVSRGPVMAKRKGLINMYFVLDLKP